MRRLLWSPLLSVLFGLAPFLVFGGTTRSRTVNGVVVEQSSFNLLGLGLAIVGMALAGQAIMSRVQEDRFATTIAFAGLALCLFQLPRSIGSF